MKKTLTTALVTLLAVLAMGVAAALLAIFTGVYNVAATESHWPITRWAFSTAQHRSVAARVEGVPGSAPTDSATLAHGFEHFHAMCVQCHGAPGFDRGEVGKGLSPLPPRLEETADEWSDAGLFWIIRNGIRLTGMPAFGLTHGDDEIWGIVGFLRQLEDMTEEEYAALVRATFSPAAGAGVETGGETGVAPGGHTHAPGTPEHGH